MALFAALSYVVASSTRSGSGSTTSESAKLAASQIADFGAKLQSAVQRALLMNNCNSNTLNFNSTVYLRNDGVALNVTNSNAPANHTCSIFYPQGGGVIPLIPDSRALDVDSASVATPTASRIGHGAVRIYQIKGIGTDGAAGDTSANDFVFQMSFLNRDTCLAINRMFGIQTANGEPPTDKITGARGGYGNGSLNGLAIADDASFNSHSAFCHYESATDNYMYIQAIIER